MAYQALSPPLRYIESRPGGPRGRSAHGKKEEAVSANKFVLRHGRIEIEYTIGITPGFVALSYKDGNSPEVDFKTTEITTDETALGSLVSVLLVGTTDVGGERFGFFLPQLDVPRGETERFTTVGVYEKFSGPDSVPHRRPSWRSIELHGTAATAIVPV
jgi:hypothetical protein